MTDYTRPERATEINPPAGLGWCPLRKVSRYPDAPHYCRQREVEGDKPES